MFNWFQRKEQPTPPQSKKPLNIAMRFRQAADSKSYDYPIKPPYIPANVTPKGITPPVMAMDYSLVDSMFSGGGFPGFQYLSQLATRAEYRQLSTTLSTELTRKWIEFTSSQDDDSDSNDKITAIESEFKRLKVQSIIQKAAEHDCLFGRGQIFINLGDSVDKSTPLILDPRTVQKGSLKALNTVEAIWTTPNGYDALDPTNKNFYKPYGWFMLGQQVHSSRLMTIATRPLPDMLKPAFNFAGISLSQLAQPYIDNWLRTRTSVSDLISNFSTSVLATDMSQILQGDDDGSWLAARADLFTATRSNRGLMLLDKEREEFLQNNTPLGGLHELQAQSQEHLCSVSRIPAMILTGISPSGLNASSEGEIRVFYDWIAAQQEAFWREPIETILKVVQLSLFGEIDKDIGFKFCPMYEMTPKELADIRNIDAQIAANYIGLGVLDPSEERERLAKDPNSGYQGIDVDAMPEQPEML